MTARSIRLPRMESKAGNRVSDATSVRRTVNVTARASPCSEPNPSASSPSSAMITVHPANNTDRPAVSSALVAA
jgi:hypothetical protein